MGTVVLDWNFIITVIIRRAVLGGIEAVAVADWSSFTFWIHSSKNTRVELRVEHESF